MGPSLASCRAWCSAYVEQEGLAKLTVMILAVTSVSCMAYTWGYYEGVSNTTTMLPFVTGNSTSNSHVVLPAGHAGSSGSSSSSSSGGGGGGTAPAGSQDVELPPQEVQGMPAEPSAAANAALQAPSGGNSSAMSALPAQRRTRIRHHTRPARQHMRGVQPQVAAAASADGGSAAAAQQPDQQAQQASQDQQLDDDDDDDDGPGTGDKAGDGDNYGAGV